MKAMMYADFLNLKQTFRSMALMMIILIAASFLNGSSYSYLGMCLIMVSVITPMTLCSVDKATGWSRLSLSMPILRKDVVCSKFVISVVASILMFIFMSFLILAGCLSTDSMLELKDSIGMMIMHEAIALIIMGISMIIQFKWGAEKARYILMACVWLPIVAMFLVKRLDISLPHVNWFVTHDISDFELALVTLAAGTLIYMLCCVITVKIYKKCEI